MRLSAEAAALTKLTAASTRLWQSETLEGGLEEMLSAVLELLGADKGNVQLLQPDGETLVIVAQRGFEQEYLDRFRAVSSTDGSACGRALRSARPRDHRGRRAGRGLCAVSRCRPQGGLPRGPLHAADRSGRRADRHDHRAFPAAAPAERSGPAPARRILPPGERFRRALQARSGFCARTRLRCAMPTAARTSSSPCSRMSYGTRSRRSAMRSRRRRRPAAPARRNGRPRRSSSARSRT